MGGRGRRIISNEIKEQNDKYANNLKKRTQAKILAKYFLHWLNVFWGRKNDKVANNLSKEKNRAKKFKVFLALAHNIYLAKY